jgi:hypothetical protein
MLRGPATGRRFDRIAAAVVGAGAAAVAAAFAYPHPDWLDSPELIAAAARPGLFHPPGAPLAVLLGHLLGRLPGAGPTGWMLVFSALSAGLATGLASLLFAAVGRRLAPAAAAHCALIAPALALALALGPGLLGQAVRPEVYCLGLALFAAGLRELLALQHPTATDALPAGRRADRLCALLGMGLAVHPLQAAALVPGIAWAALRRPGRRLWLAPRAAARRAAFGLLGAGPILLLPLLVRDWVDLRFGDPTTFGGWLRYALGLTYAPSFSAPAAGTAAPGLQALAVVGLGLGLPLGLLVLAGLYPLGRRQPRLLALLLLTALAGAAGLAAQRAVRLDNPDAFGYALPVLLALTTAAAGGLAAAAAALERWRPGWGRLSAGLAVGLALWAALVQAPERDRSGCTTGYGWAAAALQRQPPGAVLLLADFNLLFAVEHLTRVQGLRPDLTVLYLRDLDNDPLRRALAGSRPALAAALPGAALEPAALRRLAGLRPLVSDAGPHLAPDRLELAGGGPLWRIGPTAADTAGPPPDPLPWPAARCSSGARRDPRTAAVVCWHGYWSARWAASRGDRAAARRAGAAARCACPRDGRVARLARSLGAGRPRCPAVATGRAAVLPRPPARPGGAATGPAWLLAAGLGLWLLALLAGARPAPPLRLGLATLGLALAGAGLAAF